MNIKVQERGVGGGSGCREEEGGGRGGGSISGTEHLIKLGHRRESM